MSKDNTHGRRSFMKLTGAAAGTLALGGVASATPGRDPGPKKDEILVGVSATEGRPGAALQSALPGNAELVHENETLHYAAVKFPSNAPDHARKNFIDAMEKRDNVRYAEPNATFKALSETPDDPGYGDQYAPDMVNAPGAWATTYGSDDVTVAVVDTGTQYDHPDLAGNTADDPGQDFAGWDDDPYPEDLGQEYHGTHVSGIAGAVTDNDEGVAGISDSSLIYGRALDASGGGSLSDIADAIEWAADAGADVINLSLGGGGYTETMKNAVNYAYNQGSLIVAAAGNNGQQNVSYPAAYDECLAVSSLEEGGSLSGFSNFGAEIELAAPGSDVLSTTTTDRGSYEQLSGTSMASPVVAGVAGLALAVHDVDNIELRDHLRATAADIGLPESQQGDGRVDADGAVNTAPGDDDGDDGDDGDNGDGGCEVVAESSVTDSLGGSWDDECWTYEWEDPDVCKVVIDLDGPSDAVYDLYANTSSSGCPTTSSYDYRSYNMTADELIEVDHPDDTGDLEILVDSWDGSGEYTLTVTEYA